jgi:hypothetical protein
VKSVGRQRRSQDLFDVLVRQAVFPRERLDGVTHEKVQQNQKRIEFQGSISR